jgi:Kef-type K+ transport system membrane component KefB
MNCRGLTELVVLDIGLGLGVIDTELFTILVLMALVTTIATSTALNRFHVGGDQDGDLSAAGREEQVLQPSATR